MRQITKEAILEDGECHSRQAVLAQIEKYQRMLREMDACEEKREWVPKRGDYVRYEDGRPAYVEYNHAGILGLKFLDNDEMDAALADCEPWRPEIGEWFECADSDCGGRFIASAVDEKFVYGGGKWHALVQCHPCLAPTPAPDACPECGSVVRAYRNVDEGKPLCVHNWHFESIVKAAEARMKELESAPEAEKPLFEGAHWDFAVGEERVYIYHCLMDLRRVAEAFDKRLRVLEKGE
jgi:hypothetical protein